LRKFGPGTDGLVHGNVHAASLQLSSDQAGDASFSNTGIGSGYEELPIALSRSHGSTAFQRSAILCPQRNWPICVSAVPKSVKNAMRGPLVVGDVIAWSDGEITVFVSVSSMRSGKVREVPQSDRLPRIFDAGRSQ
jgi:hypothetical protein